MVYCEAGASFTLNRQPRADLIVCAVTSVKWRGDVVMVNLFTDYYPPLHY